MRRFTIAAVIALAGVPGIARAQQIPDECEPGEIYRHDGPQGQATAQIVGERSFKGGTYCYARTTTVQEGQETVIDYYFVPNGEDVWVVFTGPDGERQEIHMTATGDGTGELVITGGDTAAAGPMRVRVQEGESGPEWCRSGASWSATAAGGAGIGGQNFEARIEGLSQFKGGTYCKATYSMGQQMQYTWYFTEGGEDIWMVMQLPNGQTQEVHLTGGGT